MLIGSLDDALILFGFIAVSIGITLFQQRKSERALDAIKDLSSPKSTVIRDGVQVKIFSRELVIGDLILIREGERISADAELIQCNDMQVDESLLSGESVPIAKTVGELVYSGCLLVRGSALAVVLATGLNTEIGKIGKSLNQIDNAQSPLQKDIRTLIKRFAIFGVFISTLVLLLFGLLQGEWLKGLLTAISLTMALLPEEFSVILTVFMALGVWRISRQRVLTRHAPVIETLGSITTLCVDKTGTITQNKMSLQVLATPRNMVHLNGKSTLLDESAKQLLSTAVLASETEAFDPMELAYKESIALLWPEHAKLIEQHELVHEYGLTADLPAMTHVWNTGKQQYMVAIKGAPEAVMKLCQLPEQEMSGIQQQMRQMAAEGLRMLGVACAEYRSSGNNHEWPPSPAGFNFQWLGLTGLKDPIRDEVPAAVAQCKTAGIRVVMITGDHALTAQSIARQVGVASEKVLSGLDIDALGNQALQLAVRDVGVFVRIKPDQKLRIVQALQTNGEIVAMTGDGVNDAPALKVAHVGISMGLRGTDVAREASSLVLLDDNFSSIVNAIRQGRQIYDNLRKAVVYVIAVHIPIAGAVFVPLLFGAPPLLAPVHIMFLEMIIDPACAVVFEMEAPEGDVMQRPPRSVSQKIFSTGQVLLAISQGFGLMVIVLVLYLGLLEQGASQELATTLGFASLVLGNLGLILSSRSKTHSVLHLLKIPNSSQKWIAGIALGGFGLLLAVPYLRDRLRLELFDLQQGFLLLAGTAIALLWFECAKKWMGVRFSKS
jgi:P-type Ca2+ transporter type 2C